MTPHQLNLFHFFVSLLVEWKLELHELSFGSHCIPFHDLLTARSIVCQFLNCLFELKKRKRVLLLLLLPYTKLVVVVSVTEGQMRRLCAIL